MVRYKIGKSSVSQDRAKSVHLYVDGYRMRKCASLPDETGGEVDGVRTSNNTRRPFVFSDIRTTGTDHPPFPNVLSCLDYTPYSWTIQTKT